MKVTVRYRCSNIICKDGTPYHLKKIILPVVFDVEDNTKLPPPFMLGAQLERVFDLNYLLSQQLKTKVRGFDYQFFLKDIKIN